MFRSMPALLSALSVLGLSANALALPLPTMARPTGEFARLQPQMLTAAVDFTAIVALSNCSGSLVRFESSLGSDRAMVLTNGHCFEGGFIQPGTVKVGVASSRGFNLLSPDGRRTLGRLNADQVIYGTMTSTDMTLYRLKQTYDQIESLYQTRALTLSSKHPVEGRKIAVASGYWKKIYSCAIDKFIFKLKEDKWTMKDSIKYLQPGCETIGGTSGSPIIDTETKEVVGVNNTGNEDGSKCTMNNPCEVDAQGQIVAQKGAAYGQQTYLLYACLNKDNTLNLNKEGCTLPRP